MTKEELKSHYRKDDSSGCWHWSGPVKVWYMGRVWYPHLLLWSLTKHPSPTNKEVLTRMCDSEDCISPTHRIRSPRVAPIVQHQRTPKAAT